MAKFDLAAVLGDVSKLDTGITPDGREQIEYIDIALIDPDPNNFYELTNIAELAASIELLGIQQPLRVRDEADKPGRVMIVSGHRRRAALELLVKEGKDKFASVPCIREANAGSAALQELRLIYANSDTRRLSSAEISKQAERVEALLYQLKEEGMEFPGRMRDHVAEACKVSKSKLARLKVIRDGLIDSYRTLYEKNEVKENTAYALARLPHDMQERLFKAVPKLQTSGRVEQIARAYEKGWRWAPCLTCPDGSSCKRGDAFLRHDAECFESEMCGGMKCCLECPHGTTQYYACDRACSKLKAKKKDQRDEAKEKEEKEREKKQKKFRREIQASAKRIMVAAEQGGIPDSRKIMMDYYQNITIKEIRDYASGEFGEKRFYSNPLDFHEGKLFRFAEGLNCSADYLLGRTDEPALGGSSTGPAAWTEGTPTESGLYVMETDFDGMRMGPDIYRYDANTGGIRMSSICYQVEDMVCLRYIRLPED